MEFKIIFNTARTAVIELVNEGIYYTGQPYQIYVNNEFFKESNQVIQTISGLKPDTVYELTLKNNTSVSTPITFRTAYEFVTLNVKKFGAKGDGIQDDTSFIQAAILSCPKNGRVLIPKGLYKVTTLFLKSDLNLEIADGAVLSGDTNRDKYPVLPGMIESYDEKSEYNLGTWEGNPLDMFAGLITGIYVDNVTIYGGGLLEGNAAFHNWWKYPREKKKAFRPRLIFLNHCQNVTISDIHLHNSPSWTIHPYFSKNLRFLDLDLCNPMDSPNTDGIDPESCNGVEMKGVHFSLGDDCIAIKSGKIYMGSKYKQPCENILIQQCLMENGHGAVTIGSEMAGGVYNLLVKDCLFLKTDRGLRIKTRRGRGKDAILDHILFENIKMDQVMTPFVINCFYFCDPDGHSDYVKSKELLPVDERTPLIKNLAFRNIQADNCHVAAFYMYGLPEQKIEKVELYDIQIHYAPEAKSGIPAMMDGLEPMSRMGLYANNIKNLVLRDVIIEGQDKEPFNFYNIDSLDFKPAVYEQEEKTIIVGRKDVPPSGSSLRKPELNNSPKDIIITVSQAGDCDYDTIGNALLAAKQYEGLPVTIKLKNGIYKEKLVLTQNKITLLGEDVKHSVITYEDYATFLLEDGEKRGTFRTQTMFIDGNDFTAKNITFQNTAGPGTSVGQALALYVDGDRITFENCNILGGQDTLFTAPLPPEPYEPKGFKGPKEYAERIPGRHYYKNCFICGDVDFIFGGATAYFEGCEIFSNDTHRDINGYVTAASTPKDVLFGYVFNHCRFTSNCPAESVYLGRPWRDYAKVVILNSHIGAHIKKEGWEDWGKVHAHDTVYFAEYNNTGEGAALQNRVPWLKRLSEEEAKTYTKEYVLNF